jgi:hypothetical protein
MTKRRNHYKVIPLSVGACGLELLELMCGLSFAGFFEKQAVRLVSKKLIPAVRGP